MFDANFPSGANIPCHPAGLAPHDLAEGVRQAVAASSASPGRPLVSVAAGSQACSPRRTNSTASRRCETQDVSSMCKACLQFRGQEHCQITRAINVRNQNWVLPHRGVALQTYQGKRSAHIPSSAYSSRSKAGETLSAGPSQIKRLIGGSRCLRLTGAGRFSAT